MDRKKRIVIVVAFCTVLLAISLALSSGFINMSEFTITNTGFVQQAEGTPTVLIEPRQTTGNYEWDLGFNISDTFEVSIDVSDMVELYTWNVNLTWNPAVLNFTGIVSYGDFLNQTVSPHGTTRIVDLTRVSNETGYAIIAESILGNYLGVNGSGRLITLEFLIVDYGFTDLNLSLSGNLQTRLLSSSGEPIAFSVSNGYFSNVAPTGDVNDDGVIDIFDLSIVGLAYGSFEGHPNYNPDADINKDGVVDAIDLAIVTWNYGRTTL